jgi:hypothetical protein
LLGLAHAVDLSTADGRALLLVACQDERIRYIHFGPPCSTFCRAYVNYTFAHGTGSRSGAVPQGDGKIPKELLGNKLAFLVAEAVVLLTRLGKYWSIEQPSGSLMFKLPAFVGLRCLPCFLSVVFDQCMYGLEELVDDGVASTGCRHRKRTEVWTNVPALGELWLHCDGGHVHVPLQGSVIRAGRRVARTKLAASYPSALCRAWSLLLLETGIIDTGACGELPHFSST